MSSSRPVYVGWLALFIVGCGSDERSPNGTTTLLAPPEPGRGVQFTMSTTIPPGSETEKCQFVKSGDTELWVNRDEVRFTEGSHHFILFETSYATIPTAARDGRTVDTSGVFDCPEGPQSDWDATGFLGGSQNAAGDSAIRYPEGIAFRIPPQSVLLMNAHYINTDDEPLDVDVAINLHTIPESEVTEEGGILFWYDPFIRVPAMGSSRVRAGCRVGDDIQVVGVQSHMHRRGTHFVAETVLGGARQTIYETTEWEDVPVVEFEPALQVPGGTRVEYQCSYDNPERRDVYQGFTTKDEMCVLVGTYYPRREGVQSCFGDFWWEGQGTKSCSESLACLQGAFLGAEEEMFPAMSNCVLDTSPAESAALSAAVGCLFSNFIAGDGTESPAEACAEQFAACSGG